MTKTSRTARERPGSKVKRSRDQSQEAPIWIIWRLMVPPDSAFHCQTRSRNCLAGEVAAVLDAFGGELFGNHHFGGDAGVIGAGEPEGCFAAHAMPADGDVDFGVLQHVAHVEEPVTLGGGMTSEKMGLPGWYSARIDAGFDPPLSPTGLEAPGLIDFFNFHGRFQFSRM